MSILTRELYVFTRKDLYLCFGTGRQVVYEMFISEFSVRSSSKKLYLRLYLTQIIHNQTVKCSFLDEKIVFQSFFVEPLTFSYFLLQGKVLCFVRVGKSLARCLLSSVLKTLSKKLYLQLYLTQIVHSNGKKLFLQPNNC